MKFIRWIRKLFGWHDWQPFKPVSTEFENMTFAQKLADITYRLAVVTQHERCSICMAESRLVRPTLGSPETPWTRYAMTQDVPVLECKDELIRQVLES